VFPDLIVVESCGGEVLEWTNMLPSEQGVGEVILSENQEQEIQGKALLRHEPPDERERIEGARDDDPYYEAFFNRKVEGVLLATAAGEIFDASDVACRLLGRTKEELIGEKVERILDFSDPRLPAARERRRRVGFFKGELRVMRRADGNQESFDASVALTSYRSRTGEDRVLIVLRDPVEQRKAAEPRRGTEEWFFSLAHHASDVIQVRSTDGICRYTSPSIEGAWGYTPEEVLGTVDLEVVHPDDVERVRAEFAEIWARPGIGPPVEYRIRHKDGHWIHLETTANNLRDDPEVQGMLIIHRDITERVRKEEELRRLKEALERRVRQQTAQLRAALGEAEHRESMLRESLDMFRTTFDQAAVGLAHMDLQGRWIRVNERLCEVVGYSREELLKKTFDEITHPDEIEAHRERMKRLHSGEIDHYSKDMRCVRKDGSHLWINLSVSLVRHPSGKPPYFMAIVKNIDQHKRAEMILGSFTPREIQVLKLLTHGFTNRQIACELYISANTAKFHVQHVIEKLGVTDRTEAAYRAAELGLVPDSTEQK
jgi:PAS domain S-box-containing protein